MSAERERGGRRAVFRRARRPFLAATAVTVAVLALVAPAALPAAQSAMVEPVDGVALTLTAAPAATGSVRPSDPISVRVTLSNAGSVPTGGIDLVLEVDGATAADGALLAGWFAGASLTTDARPVATASVSSLDPGASAVLDLIAPSAASVFDGSFGARLAIVRATLSESAAADTIEVTDRTALVWVPDDTAVPVSGVTFVAAVSTPGETSAFLSADTLARYTADAGALTRTLDAVAGRPVLLAIDPRVIASIRLLGEQAPASATAFLDRLAAVPNDTFLLPWADADPLATIAAAGVPLPVAEGSGSRAADSEASASPDPAPVASPEWDALIDWPTQVTAVAWAGSTPLSAESTAVLANEGTEVVIASSSSLEHTSVLHQLGELQAVRVDEALSTAAIEATLAVSQQRFDRSMARVSALLAANAQAAPGIPAVIALARDQIAASDRLIDTIARSVSQPWVTGSSFSSVLAQPARASSVVGTVVDDAQVAAVQAALAAEADDRIFASIALTPSAITDIRRLELLAALSVGWGDQSVTALNGFVAQSAQLRSSVQVVESSAITLLADRASLPVSVRNGLDVPVRVFVHVDPDTAQLRVVDPRVETVVEPQSQTRALVAVESLTNGQVDITVSVRDADNRLIGSPTRVELNLQAGWETAGTISVAVALVILLAVGITRDIRKRRRRTAEHESA